MALAKLKPTSPGRRGTVRIVNREVHKGAPYKPLVESKKSIDGRNNDGRITVRHRGGGHKRKYRVVDFRRDKDGVPAKVERIEYDPNRSAHLALLLYADGERRYILAPKGVQVGGSIRSGSEAPIAPGNAMPLRSIPVGSVVHNIELKRGKGGQLGRAAGSAVQYLGREGNYAQLRLRSGEVRRVHLDCRATLGEVGNPENSLRKLGKAGAQRWRGVRPTVRGVSMNPVDHPHGGGEGRTSGGRDPVSPWGVPTKGYRTRANKRTQQMIIRRRKK